MSKQPAHADARLFGSQEPGVWYSERRAAYVVIIRGGSVALVSSGQQHFLPGGGALPFEQPEATILREVREELGRSVQLLHSLGEATQHFYSTSDDRHYKMWAAFYLGSFTDDPGDQTGEHQLEWLPVDQIEQACFHGCHAWAVREASSRIF